MRSRSIARILKAAGKPDTYGTAPDDPSPSAAETAAFESVQTALDHQGTVNGHVLQGGASLTCAVRMVVISQQISRLP